jgi:hypothetical protein
MIILTVLSFPFSSSAFAQMRTGQGSGMMDGLGWGMGFSYVWVLIIIIVIFAILGIVYMMKRK